MDNCLRCRNSGVYLRGEKVFPCQCLSTSKIPDNPKQLYGDKKIPLQLCPPAASIYMAQGLGEGAEKYGPWNWRESKVEAMTYVGAIKRHLDAWVDGENIDPDSDNNKHHLSGMIASLAILIDAIEGGFLIDNRPPSGGAPKLLKQGARKG